MRYHRQNARAITRTRIAPRRATMQQTAQDRQTLLHNPMIRMAIQIRNHAHAARVMLVPKLIQSLIRRHGEATLSLF